MKKWIIGIFVVAVLAVGAFFGYQRIKATNDSKTPQLQTAKVTSGTLTVTVTGASNITAKNQSLLAFTMSGKVKAVNVQRGDQVKPGQVLMELDTTDLEVNVAKARLSLATAQAQLAKTKTGATPAELAAAKASVASAQQNLNKVKAGPTQAQLAAAENVLEAAQANYNTAVARPLREDINQAKLKVDQAKNSLWSTQSQRDSTCGQHGGSSAPCNSAQASVANAEIAVQLAEVAYQDAQKPATTAEIANAAAQVQNTQDSLNKLRSSPTDADVATAQAQVAQAESALQKLISGATAEDLAISQAQVDQAQLSLQQAQRQLESAKLVALIAGTVTAVNYNLGDNVNAGQTAVSVVDLSSLQLVVPLAEMDVVRVAPGQQAKITLDALQGVALSGKVTYIAPVATITQGVTNYPVTIEIPKPDPAVRVGMTAAASIILEQHDNVLLVPNRAVRTVGRQKMVEVSSEGQTISVPITVGANNDSMTEISSGLKEGDTVVLRTTTTSSNRGMGGAIFMGAPR